MCSINSRLVFCHIQCSSVLDVIQLTQAVIFVGPPQRPYLIRWICLWPGTGRWPLQNNISAQNIIYLSFDLPTLSNRLLRNTSLLFFPGKISPLNTNCGNWSGIGRILMTFFTELHFFVGPPHSSFIYHRVLLSF